MEAKRLSYKEADLFQYYLEELPQVTKAVVYERTADAVICYQGERSTLLKLQRCKSSGWHTGTFRKGAEFPVSGKTG